MYDHRSQKLQSNRQLFFLPELSGRIFQLSNIQPSTVASYKKEIL